MADRTDDLNAAVRDLIDVVRTADLEAVELDDAIDRVRAVADELRAHVVPGLRMQATLHMDEGFMERRDTAGTPGRDGRPPEEFFPYSPIVGPKNPLAPPVRMWSVPVEDGGGVEIHGEVTMPAAYNGPPGSVHGGVIAEVFDELLGVTALSNDAAGFTGTLTVIYRNTTPIDQPLTMRAWLERREGRKAFAKGVLMHGETLCAESEGIFIGFDQAAFEARRADLG